MNKPIGKNKLIYNNENMLYIDVIKIFACFMVIINHTNGFILENNNFINSTFYCITFALCKVGVPLFLMVTGALILDKNYNFKKVLKCIIRVAVPVFGLSFILYAKDVGIFNIDLLFFLKKVLSNPYIIPFWYVYALIGVYACVPFIQKMIKNFNKSDYIIFLVIFLLFPSLINIVQTYLNLDINYNFTVSFFPIIISMTICGNFLSKIDLSKKNFVISIFMFILSYLLMFLSMYIPYLADKKIAYTLDSWDSFPVVLMSICLFIIIRYLIDQKKIPKQVSIIISSITSTTFGIYLIHFLLNYKLYNLEIIRNLIAFNSIFGIIILDIFVFIVSMLIILFLKKIPIIKKFL